MKKYLVIGMLLFLTAQVYAGGGHVEGGGDYLKILFREAKERAIATLKTVTPEMLSQAGANPDEIDLYTKYWEALAHDLEIIPPFIFCKEKYERTQFLKSDGEKTALTVHWPGAAIKINLIRCNELEITLAGAQILLWREAGRHVLERRDQESEEEFMMRVEPTLDALEDIAVKATQIYDGLHPPQAPPWVLSMVKRVVMTPSGQPTLTLLIGSVSGGFLLWISADRVAPGYLKFFMKVGAVLVWTVPISLGVASADEETIDEKIYLDLVSQHHEKEVALIQDPQNLMLQSDRICLEIQILKTTLYKLEKCDLENKELLIQKIQGDLESLKNRYNTIQKQLHS